MALGYLDDSKLYAIASAIRAKTGDSATMTVDDMPDEIGSISTGAQVEPLSVTENGTYSAPTGYAYSPVTVNVEGGASNVVFGTFRTSSSYGSTVTINIPYTGSGYPIAFMAFVSDGLKNPTEGHTAWNNLVKRYAIGYYSMVKDETNTAPTFSSATADSARILVIYKNSTSDATLLNYNYSQATVFDTTNPSTTYSSFLKFPNKTSFKYRTVGSSGTQYGFATNMNFTYIAVYSE